MKDHLFYKYQSLGNDFILFDDTDGSLQKGFASKEWGSTVRQLCNRNFGIGGDGILVVSRNESRLQAFIFNADGSNGGFSGNGVRCVAHYFATYGVSGNDFIIAMGKKQIACSIDRATNEITTLLEPGVYGGTAIAEIYQETLDEIHDEIFYGYLCDVGNPHFVQILKPTPSCFTKDDYRFFQRKELQKIGIHLARYQGKDKEINVQWLWKLKERHCYGLLTYERGVGMTLACSSGVAACLWVLYSLNEYKIGDLITIVMDGGSVIAKINDEQKISLKAPAHFVFSGVIIMK